jgi:hypothetical protein
VSTLFSIREFSIASAGVKVYARIFNPIGYFPVFWKLRIGFLKPQVSKLERHFGNRTLEVFVRDLGEGFTTLNSPTFYGLSTVDPLRPELETSFLDEVEVETVKIMCDLVAHDFVSVENLTLSAGTGAMMRRM